MDSSGRPNATEIRALPGLLFSGSSLLSQEVSPGEAPRPQEAWPPKIPFPRNQKERCKVFKSLDPNQWLKKSWRRVYSRKMVTLRETGELAGVAAFARNDPGGPAGALRAGTCSGRAPAPGWHLLPTGTCSRLAPAPGTQGARAGMRCPRRRHPRDVPPLLHSASLRQAGASGHSA